MCRFRPPIFFSGVVAPLPAAARRLDRLTVDNRRRRRHCTALVAPQLIAQGIMHPLPCAVGLPLAKVSVDRLPRRIIMRQTTPRTARPHMIKHSVEQLAVGVTARPAAGFGSGNQMRNVLQLHIRQIGGIRLPGHPRYNKLTTANRKEDFLNTLLEDAMLCGFSTRNCLASLWSSQATRHFFC